ncbi:hypothetical protein NC651_025147 [Populus alba x Populus x berolinensis]|nr:hypothetical protein NC651_025147 [Populus alba x Populus x berolinensis]
MYLKITSRIKFPKALDFNVYALELLMKDKNHVISMIGRELRTLIICLGTKYFVHIRDSTVSTSNQLWYIFRTRQEKLCNIAEIGVSGVHNTYASEMINSV